MLGRLIGVSLLAGIVFPAGALAGGSIGIRLVDGTAGLSAAILSLACTSSTG